MKKRLLEAALFTATRPLKVPELARIAGVSSLGNVKKELLKLKKEYSERGIEIVETKLGWQMQVKAEFIPVVASLTAHSDLSDGCKRALALIVYKEPVKQSDIIKIQGNKAYSYVRALVRRGLVRAEKSGRTKILKLTKEFEDYFGQEKEKIKEQISSEFK